MYQIHPQIYGSPRTQSLEFTPHADAIIIKLFLALLYNFLFVNDCHFVHSPAYGYPLSLANSEFNIYLALSLWRKWNYCNIHMTCSCNKQLNIDRYIKIEIEVTPENQS